MRIAIGADHRGFYLKEWIKQKFPEISWTDVGCFSVERCDYPDFAVPVVNELLEKRVDYGILLCGTGIGMSIAANRYPGIYAGIAWIPDVARRAKEEDAINILVVPADYVVPDQAGACIRAWMNAQFKGERYLERIKKLDTIEFALQNSTKNS